MKDWMENLAWHYRNKRLQYPGDKLIVVFDIDGTILDMRFVILHVLKEFDKQHNTCHFRDVKISDIDFHEVHIKHLLERLSIDSEEHVQILSAYNNLLISSMALLEAHRPFRGVLDVIRWLQLQPNTYVGLNTGRPESLRFHTLRLLNGLAKEYRVKFRDDLLFMKAPCFGNNITATKVKGIEYFRKLGYRVLAFVDNEPENLQVVSKAFPEDDILLLHADTIFKSQDIRITGNAVRGKTYTVSKLLKSKNLPKHIQFVWKWNGAPEGFQKFLYSHINWIELDLNKFDNDISRKLHRKKEAPYLRNYVQILKENNKKIKINLDIKTFFSDNVSSILKDCKIDDSCLWFYGNMYNVGLDGFRALRNMYPGATIGCPVDTLSICIAHYPVYAKKIFTTLRDRGVNRFSISWGTQGKRILFNHLRKWGMEVDIYNASNIESFLRAVLLLPDSIMLKPDFILKNNEDDSANYVSVQKTA